MAANLRKCLIGIRQKFFIESYFTKIHERVTKNNEVFKNSWRVVIVFLNNSLRNCIKKSLHQE